MFQEGAIVQDIDAAIIARQSGADRWKRDVTKRKIRCIQPHKSLHGFRAAHSGSTLASALHVEICMQICSPQTLMERGKKKRAATSGFGDQQANENKDLSHVKLIIQMEQSHEDAAIRERCAWKYVLRRPKIWAPANGPTRWIPSIFSPTIHTNVGNWCGSTACRCLENDLLFKDSFI